MKQLLENILLHVADNAMLREGDDGFKPVLQPIKALLPLHLVNPTFNAVLNTSPRLQRGMFTRYGWMTRDVQVNRLDPTGAMSDEAFCTALEQTPWPVPCPLDMLWVMNLELSRDYQDMTRVSIDSSLRPLIAKFLRSSFGTGNASWRRLQVFQSDVKAERLAHARVQFDKPEGYLGANSYVAKFEFEDGTPLGVIFDAISQLVSRLPAEHIAAVEAAAADAAAVE